MYADNAFIPHLQVDPKGIKTVDSYEISRRGTAIFTRQYYPADKEPEALIMFCVAMEAT